MMCRALWLVLLVIGPGSLALAESPNNSAVPDVSAFRDSAHHWYKIRQRDQVIAPLLQQSTYPAEQFAAIADNILLFQRANGGWPKNYDMLAVLTPEQRAAVAASRERADATFDNYNIYSQVAYLAQANRLQPHPEWADACLRGLDFMLDAQLSCGGFPQTAPHPQGFAAYITLNDGVTVGVLNVLSDIVQRHEQWEFLDDARRQRARAALDRGLECLLRCQIRTAGKLTGWCQQHHPETYLPAPARSFELASLCPQETTGVVRLLMRQTQPTAEMIAAVEAASAWLDSSQLHGIRVVKVPAPPAQFEFHDTDVDVQVVADPQAPPIWARHYELETLRPVFSGRDSVPRYSLAEIERERRTGTPWYGSWPSKLLAQELPRWRARLNAAQAVEP